MKIRFAAGALVAAVVALSATAGADALKSGPQVGGRCTPFHPLNITGPHKDEKQCLV
jgi:hypothetical protein